MIEARHFVEAARERGFHWYAGVPCSFLTLCFARLPR
jgi:phosphonopyruvate decarboxylase